MKAYCALILILMLFLNSCSNEEKVEGNSITNEKLDSLSSRIDSANNIINNKLNEIESGLDSIKKFEKISIPQDSSVKIEVKGYE